MSQIAEAYVQIIPTTKGIGNGIANEFAGVGSAAGNAMGGSLVATAGKFAAPLLAAFGAVQIGQFFVDAVKGGSTLNESLNALSVSFGDASKDIAALGETASKRLGISNREFNALSVRFSAFAKTIVGDGGDVAGLIDDLTTRGADFASVFDLEVADALTLFQSGLAGETEPLRRYGIDLSAAAVEAYGLASGIWDGTGAMTESEKVQARYGALLQQTAQVEGDRANTADSFANAQRTLNAVLQDTSDRIGIALLPALETLLPQLTSTVESFVASPEFNQFITDLGTNFGTMLPSLAEVAKQLFDLGVSALPTISNLLPIVSELVNLLADAFLFIFEPGSVANTMLEGIAGTLDVASVYAGAAMDAIQLLTDSLPEQAQPWADFLSYIVPVYGGLKFMADYSDAARVNLEMLIKLISGSKIQRGELSSWLSAMPFANFFGIPKTYGPSDNVVKPALAAGGTITKPGEVLVGEQGPEILRLQRGASVIPLDHPSAMVGSNQPIYTDAGTLIGWMRNVSTNQARLVWATNDLQNAVMV